MFGQTDKTKHRTSRPINGLSLKSGNVLYLRPAKPVRRYLSTTLQYKGYKWRKFELFCDRKVFFIFYFMKFFCLFTFKTKPILQYKCIGLPYTTDDSHSLNVSFVLKSSFLNKIRVCTQDWMNAPKSFGHAFVHRDNAALQTYAVSPNIHFCQSALEPLLFLQMKSFLSFPKRK